MNSEYRSRLTNTLLYSMKSEFYKCNPVAATTSLDQASTKGEFLVTLAGRYNDPSQWDKLSEAQQKVEQVREQIQENLKKITANRDVMMVLLFRLKSYN